MAGLNLALGRFSVAKMAISWNNCHEGRPYDGFAKVYFRSNDSCGGHLRDSGAWTFDNRYQDGGRFQSQASATIIPGSRGGG